MRRRLPTVIIVSRIKYSYGHLTNSISYSSGVIAKIVLATKALEKNAPLL